MIPVTSASPPYRLVTRYGPPTSFGFYPTYYESLATRLTVQKPPYNVNTPMSVNVQRVLSGRDSRPSSYISISDGAYPGDYLQKVAYNKAYQKLMDDVNATQSQLAATVAEARKSGDTLNKRAEWIYSFTKRKFKKRRWHKDLASLFIEYRWVYEATALDIYNAVDFLQHWSPKVAVHGVGRAADSSFRRKLTPYPGYRDAVEYERLDESARVKIKSLCKINNPNLFFAQQMGLTNPAGLAWELTKFSWLLDWFVTCGEVINSWDDRLGLEFVNPCLVTHREMTREYIASAPGPYGFDRNSVVKTVLIDRDPTIGPGPYLLVRQIKGPSLVRGATAIALLLQLLGRK